MNKINQKSRLMVAFVIVVIACSSIRKESNDIQRFVHSFLTAVSNRDTSLSTFFALELRNMGISSDQFDSDMELLRKEIELNGIPKESSYNILLDPQSMIDTAIVNLREDAVRKSEKASLQFVLYVFRNHKIYYYTFESEARDNQEFEIETPPRSINDISDPLKGIRRKGDTSR